MASFNFTALPNHLARANINFATDTFKALLVTSALTGTEADAWVDRADVTNEHAASGGYSAGGFAMSATVDAIDTANDRVSVTLTPTAANPQYTSSTISAAGLVIYKSTGTAANDLLVSFVDFGSTVASSSGDYNVTISTPLYINA